MLSRCLIRYGELSSSVVIIMQDMMLVGALGKIQPVIELKDDARIEFSPSVA